MSSNRIALTPHDEDELEERMDWETKLAALNALSECSLKMRNPGDWYVSQNIEIKDKSILKSVCGSGVTVAKAVEDHWNQAVTNLALHEYIIARHYWEGEVYKRDAVRWNGFMWDRVEEPKKEAA